MIFDAALLEPEQKHTAPSEHLVHYLYKLSYCTIVVLRK
jgi:hypothetical protein